MKGKLGQIEQEIKRYIQQKTIALFAWLQKYGLKGALVIVLGLLIYSKDINLHLGKGGFQIATFSAITKETPKAEATFAMLPQNNSSIIPVNRRPSHIEPQMPKAQKINWASDGNLGNTYSNMIYTTGDFATKNSSTEVTSKRKKQFNYIKRFAQVAQTEQEKYGIPASITLAQGLLESNVGESRLAVKNNNHFGMKCFSRTCGAGHCSNFTDDSHKDFFRKYNTAWESYRAHSKMLLGKRYKHLLDLDKKDYKNWAKGLKKAGYATDKRYAEKIINLIEDLKLYEYDK